MTRLARALLLATWLLPMISPPLLAAGWTSLAEPSELRFVARWEDQPLNGRFSRFIVTVETDDSGLTPERLRVEVDVGSADMNDREINDELTQPDWFYVERFPKAVFQSEQISPGDSGGLLAPGTLELKGIRESTSVPFTWQLREGEAELSGAMTLSRGAWSIGMGEWENDDTIADNVELEFRVVLRPAD